MGPALVWPDTLDLSGHTLMLDVGGGSGAHCIGATRRWPHFLTLKSFASLAPGGRIILHERLLNDEKTGPFAIAALSVAMLLWTEGEQYSGRELSAMLAEAGFIDIEVKPTWGYWSIVTGRKPRGVSTRSLRQGVAAQHGRVLIVEQVVPGPDTPHFSKLFDIHMLIMLTGRERTLEEYTGLLQRAGWTYRQTWYPASKMLGIVEGVKA
jgi:hypothetical protein